MESICFCKHKKSEHVRGKVLGFPDTGRNAWVGKALVCNVWDQTRLFIKNCKCTCHRFRMDNLSTIEFLAKEKKLI
jgi:hypothetical protein